MPFQAGLEIKFKPGFTPLLLCMPRCMCDPLLRHNSRHCSKESHFTVPAAVCVGFTWVEARCKLSRPYSSTNARKAVALQQQGLTSAASFLRNVHTWSFCYIHSCEHFSTGWMNANHTAELLFGHAALHRRTKTLSDFTSIRTKNMEPHHLIIFQLRANHLAITSILIFSCYGPF